MSQQPIKTGDYIINYSNRYGARLKDLEQQAVNLMQAQDQGHDKIDACQGDFHGEHYLPVSFVIDRRVYNSLDK